MVRQETYGDKFSISTWKGTVYIAGQPLAKVDVSDEMEEPTLYWQLQQADKADIDRDRIRNEWAQRISSPADVTVWCL